MGNEQWAMSVIDEVRISLQLAKMRINRVTTFGVDDYHNLDGEPTMVMKMQSNLFQKIFY
jgi:hypothetical protein